MVGSVRNACSEDVADAVVAAFADALHAEGSLLVRDEATWSQCEQQARGIVAACRRVIHDGCSEGFEEDRDAEFTSMELGTLRALQQIPPTESLRAARILTRVVLDALPDMLAGLPTELALPRMGSAVQALYRAVDARVAAAAIGYDAYLRGADHLPVGWSARLAREIHDRIGSNLSLAMRYLELHGLEQEQPEGEPDRVAAARDTLVETSGYLRDLVSGLRVPRTNASFRRQLETYATICRPAGTEVGIRIHGNVDGILPLYRDEIFLVTRECLRNAFAHSGAANVHVYVTVAPYHLMACVADDGKGLGGPESRTPEGNGMASLKERITALGGRLSITIPDGGGTSVRYSIPLRPTGFGA